MRNDFLKKRLAGNGKKQTRIAKQEASSWRRIKNKLKLSSLYIFY